MIQDLLESYRVVSWTHAVGVIHWDDLGHDLKMVVSQNDKYHFYCQSSQVLL